MPTQYKIEFYYSTYRDKIIWTLNMSGVHIILFMPPGTIKMRFSIIFEYLILITLDDLKIRILCKLGWISFCKSIVYYLKKCWSPSINQYSSLTLPSICLFLLIIRHFPLSKFAVNVKTEILNRICCWYGAATHFQLKNAIWSHRE